MARNGVQKKSKTRKAGQLQFTVLIERDEDGYYVATVPALRSCYTQAKTLDKLYPRIREVIDLCLAEEEPTTLKFVAVQQFEI